MPRKKKQQVEKWTAVSPVYRRGAKYEPGDDLTSVAQAAPQWAQRLLDAGKVRREDLLIPVEEEPEEIPEQSTEPEEAEAPDIEHPPD